MERLQQLMRGMPGGGGGMGGDTSLPDVAEKVHVSSLSLLKMLKHGRAGVPMEVMGLMLGQFIDDYTIHCVDVFAMPQSGMSLVSCCCWFEATSCTFLAHCYLTPRYDCVCGGRRSRFSGSHGGDAQANRKTGNGGGMVPLGE